MLRTTQANDHQSESLLANIPEFDPFNFTPEEGRKMGEALIRLHKEEQVNYLSAGVNRFFRMENEHYDDYYGYTFDSASPVTYIKTKYPLFIRPREHHNDEIRIEVQGKELGKGSDGTVYSAATLAFKEDQTLYLKRNDRVFKKSTGRIFQFVLSEHKFASRIFGRGSKNPIAYHDGSERFIGRVEHQIKGSEMFDLINASHRLDTNQRLWASKSLLSSLIEVHRRGIKHRDIKSENIMLDDSSHHPDASILDFGLADSAHAPDVGRMVGTIFYMSPEVLDGAGSTQQSDIYALGIILGLFWGGNAHPAQRFPADSQFEYDEVNRLSHQFQFKFLFRLKHDLTDEEQNILKDMIHGMVVCEPSKRLALEEALTCIEQLILEREIKALPDDEKIKHRQAYALAVTARKRLCAKDARYIGLSLWGAENDLSQFADDANRLIETCLTADQYVESFIAVTGVKIFTGLTTVEQVKAVCAEVFNDYEKNILRQTEIQGRFIALESQMKENGLNNFTLSCKLAKIREQITLYFDRRKLMPLTLDYIAEFNRKYLRDFQAADRTLADFEKELQQKIEANERRMVVDGRQNPMTLFAAKEGVRTDGITQLDERASLNTL